MGARNSQQIFGQTTTLVGVRESSIEDGGYGSSGINTQRTTSDNTRQVIATERELRPQSKASDFTTLEVNRPQSSPKKRHESLYSRHQRILKRMQGNEEGSSG